MGNAVRLTIVQDEGEAESLCQMLRLEGIRCSYRATDMSAAIPEEFGGWREVLVDETQLARARELLPPD